MLSYLEFKDKYLTPYEEVGFVYNPEIGWIVWRMASGENAELLHIKAAQRRKGYRKRLFLQMMKALSYDPPYHSVFGFTRCSNKEARAFYGVLGFELTHIAGLYKDGTATLFHAPFIKLCRLHHEDITSA